MAVKVGSKLSPLYWHLKPCPSCGDAVEYLPTATFQDEFSCENCGAYHPGDCGVVRPGYFKKDGNRVLHFMSAAQKRGLDAMWVSFYGKSYGQVVVHTRDMMPYSAVPYCSVATVSVEKITVAIPKQVIIND